MMKTGRTSHDKHFCGARGGEFFFRNLYLCLFIILACTHQPMTASTTPQVIPFSQYAILSLSWSANFFRGPYSAVNPRLGGTLLRSVAKKSDGMTAVE
jgi:hypothetical protein